MFRIHFVGEDDADGDRRSVLIRCNDAAVDEEFCGGAESDDDSFVCAGCIALKRCCGFSV